MYMQMTPKIELKH